VAVLSGVIRVLRLPAVLFFLCLFAGWYTGLHFPLPLPLSFAAQISAGVVIMVFTAAFGLLAGREMVKAKTPIEPGSAPVALVTTGPFRVSRNPLYLTLTTTLFATGVMLASLWIVLASLLLLLLLNFVVVPGEEARLAAKFPGEFAAYRKRVRRWL
jgi:protein-S-isoprenylcysteine O-methyltransferase Ste14